MHIDIDKMDQTAKAVFFGGLFAELNKVPFGSLGKRDMECLLIFLMQRQGILKGTNREKANALGINETRLKGYLLDARYKYGDDEKEANIRRVIQDVFITGHTKVLHTGGCFVFALEDVVQQQDFFQGMKDLGFYADTSFSREIVKVQDAALLMFLLAHDKDETHRTFKDLINGNKALSGQVSAITDADLRRKEFFVELLKGSATAVSLLLNIAQVIL